MALLGSKISMAMMNQQPSMGLIGRAMRSPSWPTLVGGGAVKVMVMMMGPQEGTMSKRGYHGLKYVRPARGMPSNLWTDVNWLNRQVPIPMTLDRLLKEYRDVFESFRVRLGMKNPTLTNPDYEPWYGMLNEKTKDEIYDLHIKDPKFWTVRKLANEYDTEMERIEAVLVLKKMERDAIAKGFVVDEEWTKKQEAMCGYPPYVTRDEYWQFKREVGSDMPSPKAWGQLAKKLKPLFQYIPEEEDISKTGLFSPVVPKGQRYDKAIEVLEGKVVRKDPQETNRRARFLFLETGNRKRGEVYIREKDGKLRTGSTIEKEEEQRKAGIWREKGKAFYIRQG